MIYEGGAVDVWCSPFTPPLMRRIFRDAPELAEEIDRFNLQENVKGWSVDEFLGVMDADNILMTGIPAYQVWSFERHEQLIDISAEDVAGIVRQAPDRLFGYYGINPYKRMKGVRELETAVREMGFRGAHLLVYGFNMDINHRDLYPYYAKCVELDVPVVIQVNKRELPQALTVAALRDALRPLGAGRQVVESVASLGEGVTPTLRLATRLLLSRAARAVAPAVNAEEAALPPAPIPRPRAKPPGVRAAAAPSSPGRPRPHERGRSGRAPALAR